MAPLRVRMLGGFQASAGETPVAFAARKAGALLARVARRPGEEVARANLAAQLWPDVPDEQGRSSLRQALATLRRSLGDAASALVATGESVRLRPELVECDAARVDAALRAGDATAVLREYAGPLLAGTPPLVDTVDDWIHAERGALASRVQDLVRARLDALAEAGEVDAGLALAEQAIALDPAFEAGYRARMRLLARRGDRAGALREYDRCREALARALDLAPGAETEALRRELSRAPDRAVAEVAPGRGRPSLAVLRFDVLSDDPTHALFARGLAEDILVELSRFRTLDVVARESSWRLEPGADPAAAGATLGAAWLLCGAIQAAGGRLRVNVRLVEAASGRQAWADRLEGDLADVFEVQDRITRSVVSALALRIDDAELQSAKRRPAENLEAYACWLRGMSLVRRGTFETDLEARSFFERALEVDPGFARAWTGLSLTHFNDWSCLAWDRWEENEREALRCAEEAVRLDDRDHVTHYILGRVYLYRREWDRASDHLARSLALNANDADTLVNVSVGRAYLGEPEVALELGATALRLNPFHADWYYPCVAGGYLVAHRARPAAELIERAPDCFVDTRGFLAACWGHLGDTARAAENARRFMDRHTREITHGRVAPPEEMVAWMLHINPFRREQDREFLLEGLERAGLSRPSAPRASAAPPSPSSR